MLHQLKKGWWSRVHRLRDEFNPTPETDPQSECRRTSDLPLIADSPALQF
jgi:hypothetical protein